MIDLARPSRTAPLTRPSAAAWSDRLGVRPFARAPFTWGEIVLWLGAATLVLPTLYENLRQSWSSEQGEHGPIVLAIGVWLVVRRWGEMRVYKTTASPLVAVLLLVGAGAVYVFGRVADQFLIESYGLYAIGLATVYALLGFGGLRRGWFALAYLIFALPIPFTVTWILTSHMRLWITEAAVASLRLCGLSIVRDGLTIMVDQYVLAVQEACSGMNSLISLSAIGLVYVYIRRTPRWWWFVLMAAPIVGFAILANFVRVLILVLLTHFFGDAVAQSYLHQSAGVLTFVVALLGVIAFDALAARFVKGAHLGAAI